jgi:hypothetical protein
MKRPYQYDGAFIDPTNAEVLIGAIPRSRIDLNGLLVFHISLLN